MAKRVSEGIWFWHPGEEKIEGIFTTVDIPVLLFDYRTRFVGGNMVNDLRSYNPKNIVAVNFAEKLKVRVMAAQLFPQYVPTAESPALGFPSFPDSPRYNRFSYRVVRWLSRIVGGKHIRAWRKANGLSSYFPGVDICKTPSGNTMPVINRYRASVVPVPADCPIFGDQPFWVRVAHEPGAGVAPIPQRKLDAETLVSAIQVPLTDSSIRQRALELGERIGREDGVATAIVLIEAEAGIHGREHPQQYCQRNSLL